MNNLILSQNKEMTMTHYQIADLVNSRQDSVKRSMEFLSERGLIRFTHRVETNKQNKEVTVFEVNERDSYVVVAQLSPEFTAFLVDEWVKIKELNQFYIPQTYGEALQLCADQTKQLEIAAPKVAFVDNLVERDNLLTATQVGAKHKLSAVKLNRVLDELGGVYNKTVKRSRVFTHLFISNGYGEIKQGITGHDQSLFTNAGEVWIHAKLISEGVIS